MRSEGKVEAKYSSIVVSRLSEEWRGWGGEIISDLWVNIVQFFVSMILTYSSRMPCRRIELSCIAVAPLQKRTHSCIPGVFCKGRLWARYHCPSMVCRLLRQLTVESYIYRTRCYPEYILGTQPRLCGSLSSGCRYDWFRVVFEDPIWFLGFYSTETAIRRS